MSHGMSPSCAHHAACHLGMLGAICPGIVLAQGLFTLPLGSCCLHHVAQAKQRSLMSICPSLLTWLGMALDSAPLPWHVEAAGSWG